MQLRSIRDADVSGRTVLVRVDFNVPLDDDGAVADATRIRGALPTIQLLVEGGANIVLCSHLGRPQGEDDALRLDPVAASLERLLSAQMDHEGPFPLHVKKLSSITGDEVRDYIAKSPPDEVLLLENLRFDPREEANDPEFARELAALADLYVSDAFGTLHRAHASTEGVAHHLPAYAGLLVEREVEALSRVRDNPQRPLCIVMGGAKISDKIELIDNLLPRCDSLLIGGAMANTFLRAQGFATGASRVEEDQLDTAGQIVEQAGKHGVMLLTPVDFVVTDDLKDPQRVETKLHHELGNGDIAADIGPKTAESYAAAIADSKTVFWNGPMGVFEQEQFAAGTLAVAHALAAAHDSAYTVVGGGESVEAVNDAEVETQIHHVSTGGGASLEFLGGAELPGLQVLQADGG